MTKPRILFIAPSSYPIFGAEANVNAKLLKVLSEGGAIIDLVCRDLRSPSDGYPASTDDYYFSSVNSITVVRTETKANIKTLLRHFKTYLKFGYVYRSADWAFDALKECERLIKCNKYDFIYTFNQPSEILGVYLSEKYNIPWVATWNDPYVWKRYPEPYGKGAKCKISSNREKLIYKIGEICNTHIFPTDRLKRYMQSYMSGINDDNSIISPHIMMCRDNHNTSADSTLKIIHSGALGRERNPLLFLTALESFLKQNTDAKIKITFVGVVERMENTSIIAYVNNSILKNFVEFIPPVTYADSLNMLKDYDCSLIIEAPCEEGIFLPSKVADYMQVGLPIFTISPSDGTLNDLYKSGRIAYFSSCTNEKEIMASLKRLYADFVLHKQLRTNDAYDIFGKDTILKIHQSIWKRN
ncbi:MAG: hypothetical protein K2G09_01005 [Paramuribaculum sp.]|nr:hypothetical protein [Paramuribaculum sp.]